MLASGSGAFDGNAWGLPNGFTGFILLNKNRSFIDDPRQFTRRSETSQQTTSGKGVYEIVVLLVASDF